MSYSLFENFSVSLILDFYHNKRLHHIWRFFGHFFGHLPNFISFEVLTFSLLELELDLLLLFFSPPPLSLLSWCFFSASKSYVSFKLNFISPSSSSSLRSFLDSFERRLSFFSDERWLSFDGSLSDLLLSFSLSDDLSCC